MAAGLVCLGFGVYYVVKGELSLAVTALGAGVILLFASTIDRFELLKGWGIEAKTRRLDASIDKAELAIKELKELAELTGGTLISLSSSVGRWGGAPSVAEAYSLSRRVANNLRRLDSSEADIRTALYPWARAAAMDLFQSLVQRVLELQQAEADKLSATMQQRSSDDQVRFAKECQDAYMHPGRMGGEMVGWRLEDFEQKVLQLFDNAPLLGEATRLQYRSEFVRASIELKFLASHLDTQDKDLWQHLRTRE